MANKWTQVYDLNIDIKDCFSEKIYFYNEFNSIDELLKNFSDLHSFPNGSLEENVKFLESLNYKQITKEEADLYYNKKYK